MNTSQQLKQQALEIWDQAELAEQDEARSNNEKLLELRERLMKGNTILDIPVIPAFETLRQLKEQGYSVPEFRKDGILVPAPIPYRKSVTHGYPRLKRLPEGWKQCSRCGQIFSILNYGPDSRNANKPMSHCNHCAKEALIRAKCRAARRNYKCGSQFPAVKVVFPDETADDYNQNLELPEYEVV